MANINEINIVDVQDIVNASSSIYEYTNFSIPPSLFSFHGFKTEFIPALIQQITDLIKAPINHPEMFGIAIPLVITLLVLEFYFGRYKREKLGWNTALGNSLVLLFVAFNLFQYLYNIYHPTSLYGLFTSSIKPWIALGLIFEGAFLLIINYFHLLPSSLSFMLSAHLPVNLSAYVAIVFVYTRSSVDLISISAAIIFYIFLLICFKLIQLTEYEAPPDEQVVKDKEQLYLKND